MRSRVEWALRALALALLAICLFAALRARAAGPAERGAAATLRESLARWTTVARPERVHIAFERPPDGVERDWLAALPGAGTAVTWSGPDLLPTAVAMEPRIDPAGGADVSVAAPADAMVRLRDTLGALADLRAGDAGVRVYVPKPRATLDAAVGPVVARAALRDSLTLRRLLVIGAAGWETKFVTAALEERGWAVDAHVVVSPETTVRQGSIAAIDTARYSAVLALDTTAARFADRIGRFVRMGGGLVLWSPAARARALAPLAAGRPGDVAEDEGRPPPDDAPRDALSLAPITRLAPDAVVLERRGADIALAARRIGAGRVLQTGYVNSWRWRMAGGEDAPERHRTWLAGLVARVAYAGRTPVDAPPTDVAPLATLMDALGAPTPPGIPGAGIDPTALAPWIFGLLMAALLLEWASRRLRGAR
ncbi:MAG TPA: hypothetical protein VF212_17565 [Longimicrobiales bacterium]